MVAERQHAGEHLEQDHAGRVDIRATIDEPAERLLRRHVRRRADHESRARQRVRTECRRGIAHQLDDAEVDDLDALPAAHRHEDHVVGLEVAMHETLRVRVRNAVEDLPREHERLPRWKRAVIDALAERDAADLLHDEKQHTALDEHVDGGDQVRVLEQPQRIRLAREPCGHVVIVRIDERRLHRIAAAGEVLDLDHAAHATAAERADDAIAADDRSWLELGLHGGEHPSGSRVGDGGDRLQAGRGAHDDRRRGRALAR